MNDLTPAIRQTVVHRAAGRCEYCKLSQAGQAASFHVDHVIPRVAGGPTTENNLALACVSCSLRKAAKQKAIDSDSGQEVPMFNPRKHSWAEHFRWEKEIMVGLTPVGRATISALQLNRPLIVAIRMEEAIRGRHPH
jgi:hypothetical protein